MDFIVKCRADYEQSIGNIALSDELQKLMRQIKQLPDEVIASIFHCQSDWNNKYYEEFLSQLPTELSKGITVDCREIDFNQVITDTYRDRNAFNYVIKPGSMQLHTEVPVSYNLGLIGQPFLAGDSQAQQLVLKKVTELALSKVNEAATVKITDLDVGSISYDKNGETVTVDF